MLMVNDLIKVNKDKFYIFIQQIKLSFGNKQLTERVLFNQDSFHKDLSLLMYTLSLIGQDIKKCRFYLKLYIFIEKKDQTGWQQFLKNDNDNNVCYIK